MKNNIPPFTIGQKVVYTTGINMPKNSIHVVSDIHKDPCGCWVIAINKEPLNFGFVGNGYTHYSCPNCGSVRITGAYTRKAWLAISFKPIQEMKAPLLTFEKIKEEEKEEILTLN